jgi:hypothetical protein
VTFLAFSSPRSEKKDFNASSKPSWEREITKKFGDVVGEERICAAVSDASRAASHDGYFAADVGDFVE